MRVLVLGFAIAACWRGPSVAVDPAPQRSAPLALNDKSLFVRLGGLDAIAAIVDELLVKVAADQRINQFFKNADAAGLRRLLVEQICHLAGGPCTYSGKDMKTAHLGMEISNADFDAFVGDLRAALERFRVPEREMRELLSRFEAMRPDIVIR